MDGELSEMVDARKILLAPVKLRPMLLGGASSRGTSVLREDALWGVPRRLDTELYGDAA